MSKQFINEVSRMKDLFGYKKGQVISEQDFLKEDEIPYPTGISKQAVDKIMSYSAQNKKGFRGSYLFPTQAAEIDKEFGGGTYEKFLSGGGQSVFDKKNTFIGTTTKKPQQTQIRQIPLPAGLSKQAYDAIMSYSAQNKKGFRGSYLFPTQAAEIDKKYGAGTFQKFIDAGGNDVLDKKATFIDAPSTNTTTTKGSTKEEYPQCIQVFGNPRASKSGTQFSINGTGDWADYFFYPNGFYGSHKITGTQPPHGKYVCDGAIIKILPLDGEKTIKPVVKTKDVIKPTPVVQIPKELKDVEGVKKFQDWMDTNHPNWIKGKNLNKGGGYGKFGPNTKKAWDNQSYRDEYLGGSKANTGGLGVPSTDGGETITPTYDSENPYLMRNDRG